MLRRSSERLTCLTLHGILTVYFGLARTTLARIPLAGFARLAAARFDHSIGPRQRGDRVAVFWPGEPCASRPFLYLNGLLGNSHVS